LTSLKSLSLALAILGILAGTLLVAWNGFGRVAASVLSVGYWGFLLLSGWQFLVAAVLGIAWRVIAPATPERRDLTVDGVFIWARLLRDASASCLPFSQVGGFAVGVRALVLHGQAWPVASTSAVGDMTAEFLAEIVFAAAALVIAVVRHFNSVSPIPFAMVAVLTLGVGFGLLYLPRRAAPLCARLGGRIVGRGFDLAGARSKSIEAELGRMYSRVDRFAACSAIHFLGWVAKGAGGWITFRLLGAPIGFLDALAIEALLHAALAFAFLVPGNAGVQEGAYMLLGAAFGVTPEIALGTSLVRRARDIGIGIPILLIWQFIELRRLRTDRR
jgi:glycosyltransferase 2 family protein